MHHHNTAAGKQRTVRTIAGLFQSAGRCAAGRSGSAFERSLKARALSEAGYALPMPRF